MSGVRIYHRAPKSCAQAKRNPWIKKKIDRNSFGVPIVDKESSDILGYVDEVKNRGIAVRLARSGRSYVVSDIDGEIYNEDDLIHYEGLPPQVHGSTGYLIFRSSNAAEKFLYDYHFGACHV